jgi:hypothetical protein
MLYLYGAPCKTRNFNVVYIWTYVWQCWNPSLSLCCTMFQHWINAETFPVSQLFVNTLPATKITLITNGIWFGSLRVNWWNGLRQNHIYNCTQLRPCGASWRWTGDARNMSRHWTSIRWKWKWKWSVYQVGYVYCVTKSFGVKGLRYFYTYVLHYST